MGGGRICIYSPRGWMSVGLAGDSANRKGSQRVCVCTCFAWHRRNDGNNGQDTQECMNLTYFYTTYLSTKNDFKNFMSNLNPSPVRSDHVSNGPCQYCTVFRLGSPAYRTPSSFRMKSRPAAACPDSESRCLEIRDLAAAHPKRPTRGGLRPRGRRRAYELHQGQPPLPSSPSSAKGRFVIDSLSMLRLPPRCPNVHKSRT